MKPQPIDPPDATPAEADNGDTAARGDRLSYKFQRLRERLRNAITYGELAGKLPGERQLAKRFRVNAKTLSKALTDLAAEGLIERSIGRGTYVRGAAPEAPPRDARCVVLVENPGARHWLVDELQHASREMHVVDRLHAFRPSDLQGVKTVIDLGTDTPEATVRDLLVRGVNVISVNKLPDTYSTHAVIMDRPSGAANLTRELVILGHRSFFVVEPTPSAPVITDAVRQIAARYDAAAVVHSGGRHDVRAAVGQGATAIVVGCRIEAEEVCRALADAGTAIPGGVSITAVGIVEDGIAPPCSGYYVRLSRFVEAITRLAHEPPAGGRPAMLWLAGSYHEGSTTGPAPAARPVSHLGDGAGPVAYR